VCKINYLYLIWKILEFKPHIYYMSFINGNTVQPVNNTYIGYSTTTTPFNTTSYNSGTNNFLYDTYIL
jgi:hypothetical protein